MPPELGTNLFVYGTLRKGCRANYLMGGASFLSFGKCKGSLVYIDRYPGLILAPKELVAGEVYQVNSDQLLELDQYEGCFETPPHYLRQSIIVEMESGEAMQCESYVFQQYEPNQHPIVEGNDWLKYMENSPELNS